MRHTLFLALALMLALPLGDVSIPLAHHPPVAPLVCSSERPCANDSRASRAWACIEDEAIERRLTQQATQLIESGRTVDAQALMQQLDRSNSPLEIPELEAIPREPSELFASAKESVVVVAGLYHCPKCARWHANSASGFVIERHGIVVTNYHVIHDSTAQSFVVMTADQRVLPVESILAASRADDLAIVKVSADDLLPLPVALTMTAAPVGSPVTVISHPDRQFYCCTCGVVSRYFKTQADGQPIDAISITADYARGSSGAPVLNSRGQVVAIVKSTESVYYSQNGQQQRDLQMVFKTCVPATSLRKLLRK